MYRSRETGDSMRLEEVKRFKEIENTSKRNSRN